MLDVRERIRVRFKKDRGRIVEFVVQYETLVKDEWRAIVRYDTAHGQPHTDVFKPDGTRAKTLLHFPQPIPVKLSYSAPSGSNSPSWMAKELGLFERHGLQVSMIYIGGGTRPVSVMLAGETDFTIVTGPPSVLAKLSGGDTVILATFINGLTVSIVARPEITKPSDLKGKSMAVSRFGVIGDFAT